MGVVAALWGCAAGKLMFLMIDRVLFFSSYELMELSIKDMGIIFGLPTGLAWWVLYRRELAAN